MGVKCFKPTGVNPSQSRCWDLHPQRISPWTSLAVTRTSLNKSSAKHPSIISSVSAQSFTELLTDGGREGKIRANISSHKDRQFQPVGLDNTEPWKKENHWVCARFSSQNPTPSIFIKTHKQHW